MSDAGFNSIELAGAKTYTAPRQLTFHKYLPLALVYFFFNAVGLPWGLFYINILAPEFYVWLYLQGRRWITTWFLLGLAPFFIAHWINGISSLAYYARTTALLWTVYLAVYGVAWALLHINHLERLFDELIVANFCAVVLAIMLLPTPWWDLLWHNDANELAGASRLIRLTLLTSEPAVYASLMLPLLVFATLRLLYAPRRRNFLFAAMVALPFLLTQSFSGLGVFIIGIAVAVGMRLRQFLKGSSLFLVASGIVLAMVALLVIPNPIAERMRSILAGSDSSAHTRTLSAFLLAYMIAAPKSLLWGVGLGQSKLVDVESFKLGYTTATIPNAVAGTFAELGIVGVIVRFAVEIYLFFRTRVYTNTFRLAMFVVSFAQQLGGGYLSDVQGYLMWCFAFAPFFPEMGIRSLRTKRSDAGPA